MSERRRQCVECPKCHMRYLLGFRQFDNGARVVPLVSGSHDAYLLYCSCGGPPVSTHWLSSELKTYIISNEAFTRGYGEAGEIRLFITGQAKA
jgi:hypothetical protein